MHQFCATIDDCYSVGNSREEILSVLRSAADVYARSPFVSRLQNWPRGYPGDFESIEYIVDQINKAPPHTVEYFIEQYSLGSPISQQHRNKVAHQASLIRKYARKAAIKILIVACGSAPDVRSCMPEIAASDCRLVLNDMDADALSYIQEKLSPILDRLVFIKGNVLTNINKLAPFGPFDLILCGGLFDYLTDNQINFLLHKADERLLAPGGVLFFSNIGTGNPYRTMIEHFGAWRLIERDKDDLCRLVSTLVASGSEFAVTRDGTGLAYLAELKKGLNKVVA